MFRKTLSLVLLVWLVAACGQPIPFEAAQPPTSTSSPVTTAPPNDSTGGFGSPSQAPGEFSLGGRAQPVSGMLQMQDDGCWYVVFPGSTNLVVFPVGFEIPFDRDPSLLVDSQGVQFSSGMPIDGTVHELPIEGLPGGPDGRWGNYVRFCDPVEPTVAVFESMSPGFDPAALTDDEVAAVISRAAFSKSWPCGRGWAISTDDEQVGLFIYQNSEDQLSAGATILLPDDDWTATVVFGKHLFVNHCDDVFDLWEPSPVFGRRWVVTSGSVQILNTFPTGFDSGEVGAILTDGLIEAPGGLTIALPVLELFNRSFNAFAG